MRIPYEPIEGEIFKPVLGYEGLYEISNLGRVKSVRIGQPRIMTHHNSDRSAKTVVLEDRMCNKTRKLVKNLVAIAFCPRDYNHRYVAFIDGDQNNVTATNLKWVTPEEAYNMPQFSRLRLVKYQGKVKPINEWAEELGVRKSTLRGRYERLPKELRRTEKGDTLVFNPEYLRTLTVGDVTKTLIEWSRLTGLPYMVIHSRIKLGWPPEDVIKYLEYTRPVQRKDNFVLCGIGKTAKEWCAYFNIAYHNYRYRLKHGWTKYEIFFTPVGKPKAKITKYDVVAIDGVIRTIAEWKDILGISEADYLARRAMGMSPYKALTATKNPAKKLKPLK